MCGHWICGRWSGDRKDGQNRKSKDCRSVAEWRAVSAASGTRKWTCELEGLQCFPPPPDSVYLACQPLHSILQHTNTHAYFIHTHAHTFMIPHLQTEECIYQIKLSYVVKPITPNVVCPLVLQVLTLTY